ncbi:MAG: hypothetical protein JWM11_7393 [Planctomycetaceae bacterium]|nr:hypothetical protein [Planctomycetaceae bacterium]
MYYSALTLVFPSYVVVIRKVGLLIGLGGTVFDFQNSWQLWHCLAVVLNGQAVPSVGSRTGSARMGSARMGSARMGSGTAHFRFGGLTPFIEWNRSPPILNSAVPDPSSDAATDFCRRIRHAIIIHDVTPSSLYEGEQTSFRSFAPRSPTSWRRDFLQPRSEQHISGRKVWCSTT